MNNNEKISRLGILLHPTKTAAKTLATEVMSACSAVGMSVVFADSADSDDLSRADAIAVLGGDGTILRALRLMNGRMRPVLGVNLGTMGFLAECAPDSVREAMARLARGEYRVDERMLLRVECEGMQSALALNDVVVNRGSCQRVMYTEIFVNGQSAAAFSGDGAVIASPTGSTAYSLSAGGPVLAPDVECIVLSPVCPHTLSARPMVVSASSEIRADFNPREAEGELMLSVDGAAGVVMREASVFVRRAQERLPFIRLSDEGFFTLLREKLSFWGGSAANE